jgi:arylformamidase
MSIDRYEDKHLPVHKLLLSNDVLIVEGLELNNIPPGRYEIYIMPLNVHGMDGLPARVVAQIIN